MKEKVVKKNKSSGSSCKPFVCQGYGDCRMEFSRQEHLARHIRKHTGEKPFQCHLCLRFFSRLDNLKQHVDSVHSCKVVNEVSKVKKQKVSTMASKLKERTKRTKANNSKGCQPIKSDESYVVERMNNDQTGCVYGPGVLSPPSSGQMGMIRERSNSCITYPMSYTSTNSSNYGTAQYFSTYTSVLLAKPLESHQQTLPSRLLIDPAASNRTYNEHVRNTPIHIPNIQLNGLQRVQSLPCLTGVQTTPNKVFQNPVPVIQKPGHEGGQEIPRYTHYNLKMQQDFCNIEPTNNVATSQRTQDSALGASIPVAGLSYRLKNSTFLPQTPTTSIPEKGISHATTNRLSLEHILS